MKPASLTQLTSAGGVIFRKNGPAVEVVLISVRGGRHWCIPKGIIDSGETPEMTAVREVREETGLQGEIRGKLGDISYWYYIQDSNTKCRKTVHLFLMEYTGGSTDDHDIEVDEARWFPIDAAIDTISYRGDRSVLLKAKTKLKEMGIIE